MLDGVINNKLFAINGSRYYTPQEIISQWTIPTPTVVYRSSLLGNYRRNPKFKFGDNVLFINASINGDIYGIDEYTAVYRKQSGSVTNSVGPIRWAEINITHLKALKETFNDVFQDNTLDNVIAAQYIYLIRRHTRSIPKMTKYVLKAIGDVPFAFLKSGVKAWILRK